MICCRCGVNTTYGCSAGGKFFCHNCACISLMELTAEGYFDFEDESPHTPQPGDTVFTETESGWIEEKIPAVTDSTD